MVENIVRPVQIDDLNIPKENRFIPTNTQIKKNEFELSEKPVEIR